MEHNDVGEHSRTSEPIEYCEDATSPPMALTLDAGKYEHFFDDQDLTQAQKREYLETLWNIVVSFIYMGVEVRPAPETCGKPTVSVDCRKIDPVDVVKSELQNLNNTFVSAVDEKHDPRQGGTRNEQ